MSYRKSLTKSFIKVALEATLQPHQQRVLDKLKTTDSLLLYHGLGSGKTLSAIAATDNMKTNVVVPASLRENYKKELKKFKARAGDKHITSYEGATRHGLPAADALVIDEAHRLGTSESKRTQAMYA